MPASVGWRIPGRAVVGTLEVKNLFDEQVEQEEWGRA
jgi:hypothetical protein